MTKTSKPKVHPEHPKYQHMTGVFPSDMAAKSSRKGENIRVCVCPTCQKIDLDKRIQNKCPRCDQWVFIESVVNEKGRLLAEICPSCREREKKKMGIHFKHFTSVDCPKCVKAEPTIKELEKHGCLVEQFSSDDSDGLAEASFYGILSAPTLIMFNGEDEVTRWTGDSIDKKSVLARLDK